MPQDNDWKNLTFSQRNGYEEIPQRLNLEMLDKDARNQLWNILFSHLGYHHPKTTSEDFFQAPWGYIIRKLFVKKLGYTVDDHLLHARDGSLLYTCKEYLQHRWFNEVFDFLEYIIRQPECPKKFINEIKKQFEESRLAYVIDTEGIPTIHPATTKMEGKALLQAFKEIREAELTGAEEHLRKASSCIHQNDWKGAIRESIHTVESVARQLDPKGAKSLKGALSSLDRQNSLHPALREAMLKLYGYASNEQGIRHALLDKDGTDVGPDEALYMLGACSSFASYLWRKHQSNNK